MNQNYGIPQNASIRPKNIVGAVGAIVCAVTALCMSFLPFFSGRGASSKYNLFWFWGFGDFGGSLFEHPDTFFENVANSSGDWKAFLIAQCAVVYSATAAFFALCIALVFVAIGKLTALRTGKKVLAVVFSIIALVFSVILLASVIFYLVVDNKLNSSKAGIGAGPILMTVFALGTVIFSFISESGKINNAPRPEIVSPQQGYAPQQGFVSPQQSYAPQQGFIPPQQGFAPQQGFVPPQQGFVPPQQGFVPQQQMQPIPQAIGQDLDNDPPTVAQIGALEGVSGDYASAVINMRPGEKLIIGRDPTCCNIVLSSEKKDISRTHCSVKYDPYTDSFKVIDMSSNGTFVNGTRLVRDQETQFSAGTVISLGGGENQFRLKKL